MACHFNKTDEEIVATVCREEQVKEEIWDEDQVSLIEKVQKIHRTFFILDLGDTYEQ